MANQYQLLNEIASIKAQQTEAAATLDDVKKFVNQRWQMNDELKVCTFTRTARLFYWIFECKDNVLLIAKDLVFNARHVDYVHLKSRVRVSVL